MNSWSRSWQLSTPTVTGSQNMSLRDHTIWKKVPMFKVRTNQAIAHGCNWNRGDIPYSELETVLHRYASSVFAIHSFRPQNTEFISGFIDLSLS